MTREEKIARLGKKITDRKAVLLGQEKLTEELFSRAIAERLKRDFDFLLPYYDYFVTLEGDPDPREL